MAVCFNKLWKKDAKKQFISPMPDNADILEHEKRLNYTLPKSYIALMQKTQNGGLLQRDTFLVTDEKGTIIKTLTCTYISAISTDLESETERKQFAGLANLPDIGIYFAENVNARRSERFAFDYSECGNNGEPKISFVKSVYKEGKTIYTVTTIAPDFESFIGQLSVAPALPAFDFVSLKKELKNAAKSAFQEIVKSHTDETINAFGLYTDDMGGMVAPAVNTLEHLGQQQHTVTNQKDKEYYLYATAEWKYEGIGGTVAFEPINEKLSHYAVRLNTEKKLQSFRNNVIDVCITVLEELKAESFFNSICKNNFILMVNISNEEIPKSKLSQIIKRLNKTNIV